jgi:hypothetical protein
VIPTAPLRVRNRLAGIVLQALAQPEARRELQTLGDVDAPAPEWLEPGDRDCRPLVRQRAQSAAAALAARPPARLCSRADVIDAAAALFDAHLYFEVHELLEPSWRDAEGGEREALQGLIQIAVGYQHLANGNLAGARALLDEGGRRLDGRALDGLALAPFGRAVARSAEQLSRFDWRAVPRFPRPRAAGGAVPGVDVNVRKETS